MSVPATGDNGRYSVGVIDTMVPLTQLTPGYYTLQIDARLAGGKTARREMPFDVR